MAQPCQQVAGSGGKARVCRNRSIPLSVSLPFTPQLFLAAFLLKGHFALVSLTVVLVSLK